MVSSAKIMIAIYTDLVIHEHTYEKDKCLIYAIIEDINWCVNIAWIKIKEIYVIDSKSRPYINCCAPKPCKGRDECKLICIMFDNQETTKKAPYCTYNAMLIGQNMP